MGYVYIKEDSLIKIADMIRGKSDFTRKLTIEEIFEELEKMEDSGIYLWSKKETEDGEVIYYTVGNDINKYPNGGWQDGGYWELVNNE